MAEVKIAHVIGDRNGCIWEALIVNADESIDYIPGDVKVNRVKKLEFEIDWPLMPTEAVFVKGAEIPLRQRGAKDER